VRFQVAQYETTAMKEEHQRFAFIAQRDVHSRAKRAILQRNLAVNDGSYRFQFSSHRSRPVAQGSPTFERAHGRGVRRGPIFGGTDVGLECWMNHDHLLARSIMGRFCASRREGFNELTA
jgi:hypothetical protein